MKLITIKEVAEILNIKPATLYQWAELKQIPCFKLNGCLRFDIEDIMEWIKECKKIPVEEYNTSIGRRPRKGGQIKDGPV
jgi:excisionase family DNA binding protein